MPQIYNHYQYYYSILADVERLKEGVRWGKDRGLEEGGSRGRVEGRGKREEGEREAEKITPPKKYI